MSVPIKTWYRVGGDADLLVEATDLTDVRDALDAGVTIRTLGGGANLLVDDTGVPGLVLRLGGGLAKTTFDERTAGAVRVGSAVDLQWIVAEAARRGLAGLEPLVGVPGTIGGAVRMNAGGRLGAIADVIDSVTWVRPGDEPVTQGRSDIDFDYRRCSIPADAIILGAALQLTQDDPERVKARRQSLIAEKRSAQPMADRSAGCAFRNPTLKTAIDGLGEIGDRVAAGRLIDLVGAKGLALGAANVSRRHANFFVVEPGGCARDVLGLMRAAAERVYDAFGVRLEREVRVWSRDPAIASECPLDWPAELADRAVAAA